MIKQDLDTLIQAIKEKKVIAFQYNKEGKTFGTRIGAPYVIYSGTDGTKKYVDLYQSSGISDRVSTGQAEFPHWVTLELEFVSDVALTEDTFVPISGYKRYSKKYMIANIKI